MTIAKHTPTNGKSHPSPLRQQQGELTKKLILQALTEIVAEDRILSFTVEDVANRAGVSHRSVYRHFPTKEALFKALYESTEESLDPFKVITLPKSADGIPLAAEEMFAIFDKYPAITRALNIASMAYHIDTTQREKRNQLVQQLLTGITCNLDPGEATRAFAVIRNLISGLTWQTLRERFGLDGPEAGKAIAWALEVLIQDLKKRNTDAKHNKKRKEDQGNG